MRHGRRINHLGMRSAHRRAVLAGLACSLLLSKRIVTTVPKARALRKFVEPILTAGKSSSVHAQRLAFSHLGHNKAAVQELFGEIGGKIADRRGGYTRIIKLQDRRLGDNADMCLVELVDYSDYEPVRAAKKSKGASTSRSRTRRGRGKKNETKSVPVAVAAEPQAAAPHVSKKDAKTEKDKSSPPKEGGVQGASIPRTA